VKAYWNPEIGITVNRQIKPYAQQFYTVTLARLRMKSRVERLIRSL